MADVASQAASTVGLWWPAADEQRLRDAAGVWERVATALDAAAAGGTDAATRAASAWQGEAAAAAARAWHQQAEALAGQATDARRVAGALREYADAVADAKRRVEELVAAAGATLLVGTVAAVATMGIAEAAAAGVTAGLVSAAAAVGVELSGTVAAITAGALTAATFGAAEGVLGDVSAQAVRVEAFDDGGYSPGEFGRAALSGGLAGGVVGGGAGALAVAPIARTAAGDLSGLRAPGGRIRAVLDPPNWGAQGGRFEVGVHELPGARAFQPHERPTAELLASEGRSVHARAEANVEGRKNPDSLVRTSRADPGTYTEFKRPVRAADGPVKNEIMKAARQLEQYGGGDLVLDGRSVGLDSEVAENALKRAVGQAHAHSLPLPDRIRIVLADGSSIYHP